MDKERFVNHSSLRLVAEHARDLPWRIRPTAYRVWVSEIMLQQTRVEAVKPFYARFTDVAGSRRIWRPARRSAFKAQEGLCYSPRQNIQKSVQMICEQYDGVMPVTAETLHSFRGLAAIPQVRLLPSQEERLFRRWTAMSCAS